VKIRGQAANNARKATKFAILQIIKPDYEIKA
jgi:hypothetical protein